MNMKTEIDRLKQAMQENDISPEKGLGEELFLFASTLMPVVNVDLLVMNERGQILLAWRDDPHCGRGWHVPGGCIRFMETMEERIQKTAVCELGEKVIPDMESVKVVEILEKQDRAGISDQRERAHFITLAVRCRVSSAYVIPEERRQEGKAGCLKWFDGLPEDLLPVQGFYRDLV